MVRLGSVLTDTDVALRGIIGIAADSLPKAGSGFIRLPSGIQPGATMGYRLTRSGSVIALSVQFDATIVVIAGTVTWRVLKGSTATLTLVTTISATGQQGAVATAASGTHPVSADDVLNVDVQFGTFTGTIVDTNAYFEVE